MAPAAAAPASSPVSRWRRLLLAFAGLVLLIGSTAFAGAWMGIRSVETSINHGPQEVEEDESASLPQLTLTRGLDISMERSLPRQGGEDRFLRGLVNWRPGGRLSESAPQSPVTPDQEADVERPMVPRPLADTRVDRDPSIISAAAERAGRLGGAEPIRAPRAIAGARTPAETGATVPGNPGAVLPDASPQYGVPASTISPPSVYNDAVGEAGRRSPVPYAAEYAPPLMPPPVDASPLESGDDPGWRQRGLVP